MYGGREVEGINITLVRTRDTSRLHSAGVMQDAANSQETAGWLGWPIRITRTLPWWLLGNDKFLCDVTPPPPPPPAPPSLWLFAIRMQVNGSLDPWHSLGIINSTSPFYESCTDTCTRQVTPRAKYMHSSAIVRCQYPC